MTMFAAILWFVLSIFFIIAGGALMLSVYVVGWSLYIVLCGLFTLFVGCYILAHLLTTDV